MKWGPNEDPRQPKQGLKLNCCKVKESIARIANPVSETVLMEVKEADNRNDEAVLKTGQRFSIEEASGGVVEGFD